MYRLISGSVESWHYEGEIISYVNVIRDED